MRYVAPFQGYQNLWPREVNMCKRMVRSCAILLGVMVLTFTGSAVPGDLAPEDEACIDRLVQQVEAAESIDAISALDGHRIDLNEFFEACDRYGPPVCVLFEKFYHWPCEILTTASISRRGCVAHTVRAYYNPSSVCLPESVHPLRAYGDVAEFYDSNGEFMGIVVYMGEGLYFPLPFSGYSKKNWVFSRVVLNTGPGRSTPIPGVSLRPSRAVFDRHPAGVVLK